MKHKKEYYQRLSYHSPWYLRLDWDYSVSSHRRLEITRFFYWELNGSQVYTARENNTRARIENYLIQDCLVSIDSNFLISVSNTISISSQLSGNFFEKHSAKVAEQMLQGQGQVGKGNRQGKEEA